MSYGATLTATSNGYLRFAYAIGGGTTNTPGLLPGSYSDIFATQTTDYGIPGPTGNYGRNWIQDTSVGSTRTWNSVAISSSGQYQTATVFNAPSNGYIYISSNYGVTWTSTNTAIGSKNWTNLAISSSGQYQVANISGGNIYISSDYGVTWTSTETTRNWSGLAVSASGQYQSATVSNGYIYISSNYGATWRQDTSVGSTKNWNRIAVSASGQYQTAVVFVSGYIYISSNYGVSWTSTNTGIGLNNWYAVSVSASGQYQSATLTTGNIYISSNYGVTWKSTASSRTWFGIAVSASGQYQCAIAYNNNIYISSNYGETWTSTATTRNWQGVAMSASGQYITAVVPDNYIYTCYNTINAQGVINVGGYTSGSGVTGIAGSIYYDTTTTTMKYSNGSTWRDIASLSSSGFTTGGSIVGSTAIFRNIGVTGIITVGRYPAGSSATTAGPIISGSIYYDTTVSGAAGFRVSDGSTWRNVKSFVIDHPINKDKYLVHGCLEGPEAGVYYRGEGKIVNNEYVVIELPDYVNNLTSFMTVQISPIYNGIKIINYNVSRVVNNKFTVYGENGEFFWTVFGKRLDIVVEPNKSDVNVIGDGPYKWINN